MKASDRAPRPTLAALFAGFLTISLQAFGGALPWARREIVDKRGWLGADEFTDLLGLCQFLPGPNVGNLSVAIGARFRGVPGAIAAFLGLYAIPVAIVIALGALYDRYGNVVLLRAALNGIAAVAAGLIAAMALKMAQPLLARRSVRAPAFLLLTLGGITLLHLPLALVMVVLTPLSILLAKNESA